jgi:molybdate transport system substrate-binding protein
MNSLIWRLGIFVVCASMTINAQEIGVAAASDLQFVFKEVAARFEQQSGSSVKLSFGSSGNFFSQIQNGAPYDLFFSADVEYPQKLEAAGLTEPGTLQQYAKGKLVLWTATDSGLDVSHGLNMLLQPAVKKIAVANPAHAPYGRAAVEALKAAGVYEKIADKLIYGENISQTAQFVASGNAQAGILALSLAVSPMMKSKGTYFVISEDSYPRLDQVGVVLKSSKEKEIAKCFMDFIKSPEITTLMKEYGFVLADTSVLAGKMPMQKSCRCCGKPKSLAN